MSIEIDLARECLYRFFAAALRDPRRNAVLDADSLRIACDAADLLRAAAEAEPVSPGFGELPAELLTLRPACERLDMLADERAAEYDRVFGLVPTGDCMPYETEYEATAEPFFRAQQMADVAGFYRAFGLEPSRAVPERPDYLPLELEFMALLLMKKRLAGGPAQAGVCDEAQRDFFRDHLAWWLPSFAAALRRKADAGPYADLARALAAFLPAERGRLGVQAPRAPLAVAPARPEEEAACAACV